MVPPWTPDPPPNDAPPDDTATPETAQPPRPEAPVAPEGRFRSARLNLGSYARNGDRHDMRRGLGQYIRNGYGGSGTATRRFGGTAATAAALGRALGGIAPGATATGVPLDPALLAGRSADEVMTAVVEAVRPRDGTLDAEANRAAIRDALAELLTKFPEADLLNLTDEQRTFAVERFTAIDVFRRIELDIGKTLSEKAPSASAALGRLKEIRDYVKETVSAAFRKLRDAGRTLTVGRIAYVVRDALTETFQVFEGYAE